jgi:hypothetical protein
MLIDNEDESLSELDAVEQKKQLPEVAPLSEMPEKYRQKSARRRFFRESTRSSS